MKQIFKKVGIGASLLALFMILVFMSLPPRIKTALGDVVNPNTFNRASSTQVVVGTSDVTVIATNSARTYALIVNDSDTTIYLSLSGGPASKSAGIRLNSNGGAYEIIPENNYVGAIHAITTASNKKLTVTEK